SLVVGLPRGVRRQRDDLGVDDLLVEIVAGHLVRNVVVDGCIREHEPQAQLVAAPEMDLDPACLLLTRNETGVEVGLVVVEEHTVGRAVRPPVAAQRLGVTGGESYRKNCDASCESSDDRSFAEHAWVLPGMA